MLNHISVTGYNSRVLHASLVWVLERSYLRPLAQQVLNSRYLSGPYCGWLLSLCFVLLQVMLNQGIFIRPFLVLLLALLVEQVRVPLRVRIELLDLVVSAAYVLFVHPVYLLFFTLVQMKCRLIACAFHWLNFHFWRLYIWFYVLFFLCWNFVYLLQLDITILVVINTIIIVESWTMYPTWWIKWRYFLSVYSNSLWNLTYLWVMISLLLI